MSSVKILKAFVVGSMFLFGGMVALGAAPERAHAFDEMHEHLYSGGFECDPPAGSGGWL